MANVVVVQETIAAQAFLRAIGANWQNNDLIYAVVAWMRSESGSLKRVIGNNPFNLRPGRDISPDLIEGIRKTKNGNGYFLIFKTLAAGLQATAQRLLRAGNDWRGYGLIIRAFRAGLAIDAMNAIALSAWNASHYGYKAGGPTSDNHIYRIYAGFTGLQLPKPTEPKPKPKPLPARPRDLNAPVVVTNYLHPYDVRDFYLARHHDPMKDILKG
jgi:hypothetical protein